MTDRAGRPPLFFGCGDGCSGETAGRQGKNHPLCFSDVVAVVLAKPPDGKVKITSKSLPVEKVLQRDQILEVRFWTAESGSHSGLVAARAAQLKRFEWAELTVRPHHVVIGDLDRGDTPAI